MERNIDTSFVDREPSSAAYKPSLTDIVAIAIDRAVRRDAVNPATARKLYAAFVRFIDDATRKVCVFHGANRTFCAGADL